MSNRLEVAIEMIGRHLGRRLDAREREVVGACLGDQAESSNCQIQAVEPLPFASLAFIFVRDGVSVSVATATANAVRTYMDRMAMMAAQKASALVSYRPRLDPLFQADVKRVGWVMDKDLDAAEREVLAACLGEQEERLPGVFHELADIFIQGKVAAETARAVAKLVDFYVDATSTTAGKFAAALVALEQLKPGSTTDTIIN